MQQAGGKISERWVLAATILASGMAFLEGSLVSVALPTIQRAFETNITTLQWVSNAYLLTLASFLCVSGSLGNRFGLKRVFMIGMAVFVVGTALCGASRSTLPRFLPRLSGG